MPTCAKCGRGASGLYKTAAGEVLCRNCEDQVEEERLLAQPVCEFCGEPASLCTCGKE